jgi:hypothetical protein
MIRFGERTSTLIAGLFAIFAILLAVFAAGCASQTIDGAQADTYHRESKSEGGKTEIRYVEAGGITDQMNAMAVWVRDWQQKSEQPSTTSTLQTDKSRETSIRATGEAMLKINADGSISFEPTVEKFRKSWPLGLIFVAIGVLAVWAMKSYVLGAISLALGMLTILNPALMQWLILAALLLFALWAWRTTQGVKSITDAVDELFVHYPLSEVDRMKKVLKANMKPAGKALVKKVKA